MTMLTAIQLHIIAAVLVVRLGETHPLTQAVDAEKWEAQALEPQPNERNTDDDGLVQD